MANKVYINPEATITWVSGGTNNINMNISASEVNQGAWVDLGANARSEWYEARMEINRFDTAPNVGETVDLYFSYGNASGFMDGGMGIAAAAATTANLPNLTYIGSSVVQLGVTTLDNEAVMSRIVRIASRYVIPVVHNNTVDNLAAATQNRIQLKPIPPEIQ
jgi:hypothetical protein